MLCVPSYSYNTEKWEKEIKEFSKKEKIDLIILPEGYIKCKFEQALEKVKNLSKKFNTAVLSGVETEEGYQIAVFYNLNPQKDETKEHIYIKHSTAYKLAYEYPEYQGKRDKMFDPILIKGRKLGVMICQDMFFPLIPHIMVKRGAEILIDLTGGNVIFQKWKNIVIKEYSFVRWDTILQKVKREDKGHFASRMTMERLFHYMFLKMEK